MDNHSRVSLTIGMFTGSLNRDAAHACAPSEVAKRVATEQEVGGNDDVFDLL
jgi:hypothetical protein